MPNVLLFQNFQIQKHVCVCFLKKKTTNKCHFATICGFTLDHSVLCHQRERVRGLFAHIPPSSRSHGPLPPRLGPKVSVVSTRFQIRSQLNRLFVDYRLRTWPQFISLFPWGKMCSKIQTADRNTNPKQLVCTLKVVYIFSPCFWNPVGTLMSLITWEYNTAAAGNCGPGCFDL